MGTCFYYKYEGERTRINCQWCWIGIGNYGLKWWFSVYVHRNKNRWYINIFLHIYGCVYHWHSAHEPEQALGDSGGQGSMACCSAWVCEESDRTEWLNT